MNERTTASALSSGLAVVVLLVLSSITAWGGEAQANASPTDSAAKTVMVHPKLGGFILGFDVDQDGTEGLLSEYLHLQDGNIDAATEVFDQNTGKILNVIAEKKDTQDDYVTEGIFDHIGLADFQTVVGGFAKNHYMTLDPIGANKFTGKWTPPIKKNYFLQGISNNRDGSDVAVVQFSDIEEILLYVFRSNISTNSFGPLMPFNDGNIGFPLVAYDSKRNAAVIVGSNGSPTTPPLIATVDLANGKIQEFTGAGVGNVLGLAVDSSTDVAVLTTQGGPLTPPMVDFYNVVKQTGFSVTLPGSNVGADVEFDPVHKLFVVAAGDASTGTVSLFEYDSNGILNKTISGGSLNSLTGCCVLNPATRTGFGVVGFSAGLQSFSY